MPFFKTYRAFEELDGFTDAECRHLVLRVFQRRRRQVIRMELASTLFFMIGVAALGATIFIDLMERPLRVSRFTGMVMDVVDWSPGAVLVAGFALAVGVGAFPHFWMRDRLTRRCVRDHLAYVRCSSCGASLMGASRTERRAACPGCGQECGLRAMGLEAADLGPSLVMERAAEKCRNCGYLLSGLRIRRGRVVCPECGVETQAPSTEGQTEERGSD